MPTKPSPKPKPATVDAYLAAVVPDQRAALQQLRRALRAGAPRAAECISYGLPALRQNGKLLVAFGAAKKHCALYLGSTARGFTAALASFDAVKGTIRFQPDRPLPAALVRKMIRARIAEKGAGEFNPRLKK